MGTIMITDIARRFAKQVVAATLTSGLMPALAPGNHNDDNETDAVGALAAQLAHAGEMRTTAAGLPLELRDDVFGNPLLVETIAKFA